ncbi:MAG: PAS domain S-box protein [Planctomycetaceae bacterium]|nr:PAS domain S-box protein [Planctomycetaceae bacterium]
MANLKRGPIPKALFDALAEKINDLVYSADCKGRLMYVSPQVARYGITPEQSIGRSLLEFVDPRDQERVAADFARTMSTGEEYLTQFRLAGRRGRDVWLEDLGKLRRNAHGDIVGIDGILRDITDRKEAEAARQAALDRLVELEAIIDRSPAMVFLWRVADGWPVEYVTKNVQQLGYSVDDFFSGRVSWGQITCSDDIPRLEREVAEHLQAGRDEFCQSYRLMNKSGEIRWMEDRNRVVRDAAGAITHIQGIVLDVTDRKRAEEASCRSEETARTKTEVLGKLMDVVPVGILVAHDPQCQVITGNHAANHLFEADEDENVSAGASNDSQTRPRRFFQNGRELRAQELPMQVAAASGVEVPGAETDVLLPSGRTISLLGKAAPLLDAAGKVRGSIAAFLDITDRKRYRTRLKSLALELTLAEHRERARMAKVLHDGLQQLLVAAKLRLPAIERSSDPAIYKAGLEIRGLLDESIKTSRSLTTELSPPILLNQGLTAAMQWLAGWMHETHDLTVNLDIKIATSPIGENLSILLFQCVRELLFNVVKHAGVKVADVQVAQSDGSIQISIADKGSGFDPKAPRANKSAGGFGLFNVAERLQLLGARMDIVSAPGQGSRFTITAPVASGATSAAAIVSDC